MEGRRLSGGHRSRRRWLASEIFIDQPRRRDHHLLLRSAAVPWRSSPEPPTTVDLLYRRFPCWLERERLSERERRKVSGCCAAMLVDQQDGGETSRSGSLVCGAPVKMVRVVRPPPVACRRLDSLDGSSGVASQYGLDAVHDLPEEAVVVNWLLAGGGADMMDIVFCIGSRVARWDDMLTLVLGSLAWVARVGWFREWMAVDFESSPYKDYSEVDMVEGTARLTEPPPPSLATAVAQAVDHHRRAALPCRVAAESYDTATSPKNEGGHRSSHRCYSA
nr:uncharacterized protein LOC109168900 [Ipomoea batatas]